MSMTAAVLAVALSGPPPAAVEVTVRVEIRLVPRAPAERRWARWTYSPPPDVDEANAEYERRYRATHGRDREPDEIIPAGD